MESRREEIVLEDLVKKCSSLELSKSQEFKDIEELKKVKLFIHFYDVLRLFYKEK